MLSPHHADDHVDCIGHVPIFAGLNQEEMRQIAGIAVPRNLKKGEMVYRAGDAGGALFVLHSGRVKLFRLSASGKAQVLHVIGPGAFIGELSLFSSLPLTDNAQTLDESVLCVLQGSKLKELMMKYPSIALKVMDELCRRLEKAESQVEAISLNPVTQRLVAALLELAAGREEIVLPMTKGDLASQTGMSRETLSRKLAELQNEGLIQLQGQRSIIVKNRAKLEAISLA